ncbi:MAG: transcriptional repressor NrdR [Armatimonadetes bacterium]|nr:transcriptional repressor NrdR [Armatimonadota bacterium]MBS1700642.1 transcriptional repressor NrdR [Armatimonadota bacterium]MBS1728874.1 transcriptional repressor NrdR [Armatimonadota bacterium]
MHCPFCGNDDLKVLDSRPGADGESIRRRRECAGCAKRFTTWERFERARLFVIKRDGSRCDFNREKVFDSMRLACGKRPVSVETMRQAAIRIEDELYRKFEDEVSTKEIGSCVMRELATIDTVAYVRFASVYREFETVADFAEMIERVQTEEALSPFKHLQKELIS